MSGMPERPPCPCGEPAIVVLHGLPVCRACYDEGLQQLGSIMPAPPAGEAVLVRRGSRFWRHRWFRFRGPPRE
jgi:hypothetical protein